MEHIFRRRRPPGPAARASVTHARPALAACLLAALLVAACGPGSLYTSFDPSRPCGIDGRFPGAYPLLEAALPRTFQGRAPDTIDSGRNCSVTELGTLAGHGIAEVKFAGASWFLSGNAGITLALFVGDGLTPERLGEWYESTARAARSTREIDPTRPTIAGVQAYRLDTLNGDSVQTIIDWSPPGSDYVYVVVAADAPVATIDAAVAAFPTDH